MAGGQERILRRRIKSVESTKKITRAMELIAASRIVKAQARVHAAQPYAEGITDVVRNLQAAGGGSNSPLLTPRPEIRKVAEIIIAADRGLCGGYNTTVIRTAEHDMRDQERAGRENAIVTVGRKAEGYFRFRDFPIDAAYSGFSDSPTYEDARLVASAVVGRFEAGELDRVQLVYTRFISAGRQEVVVEPLLPLEPAAVVDAPTETSGEPSADYEFEPSPDAILETLLPRYTESRVYAALLNAAASEHAARQRAMKAATDNAEDLILTYRRRMNRARQDSITTEIMEIVGGAEALSQGAADHDDVRAAEYYDKTA
ncbi:MAG TPA: F0F1 ATP synthase subunit gamma [Acidimicrobiia bacterium]|jgi:F-type H+-transporting ATPase subunit gamma|nr:F0F1 ATP synthase subunit gamma [Acidimicrobiia bacterium]